MRRYIETIRPKCFFHVVIAYYVYMDNGLIRIQSTVFDEYSQVDKSDQH